MTTPYVPPPIAPNLSDADLWEHYREQGLPADEATKHVQLRQQANAGPTQNAADSASAQDIGPRATAAQSILRYSPAGAVNLAGPIGSFLFKPGSKTQQEVSEVGGDLLGRGEAALSGMPYDQFRGIEQASDSANPNAASLGPTGLAIVPAVAGAGAVGRFLNNRASLREANLENVQLRNRILDRNLSAPPRAVGAALSGAGSPTAPVAPMSDVLPNGLSEAKVRAQLGQMNFPAERIESTIAGMKNPPPAPSTTPSSPATPAATAPSSPPVPPTGPTPSAVAPTVPEAPASSLEPIPGQPRGFTAVGRPMPRVPDAPTVTEFQDRLAGRGTGKTLPYYPRGGQAQAEIPPLPVETPNAGTIQHKAAQLKMLLSLPPEQFEAASGMIPRDILADVQQLRANGATPAHVDALLTREGQFSGAGFEGTTAAMQHPAYQKAAILARRAVERGYPAFKGMTPDAATAALQRMILEHAQRGGTIPPLTSLPKFLERLGGR